MDSVVQKIRDGEIQGLANVVKEVLDASSPKADAEKVGYVVLKEAASLYSDSRAEPLLQDEVEEVAKIIDIVCKICRGILNDSANTIKWIKVLYRILCSLVRLRLIPYSIRLAAFMLEECEVLSKVENTVEVQNIFKNCYLLLWNHALELENEKQIICNKEQVAFQYRIKALAFLSQCSTEVEKIIDQACRAIQVLAPKSSIQVLSDYEDANNLLFKVALSGSVKGDMLQTLTKLQKWNARYFTLLEKSGHETEELCLKLFTMMEEKLSPKIVQLSSATIVRKCFELFTKWYQTDISTTELLHLCRAVENLGAEATQSELQFILSVLRCIEEITASRDVRSTLSFPMSQEVTYVVPVFELRVKLLSQERIRIGKNDETRLSGNYTSTAATLLLLIRLLTEALRETSDELLIKKILKQARHALDQLTEFMTEDTFGSSMLSMPYFQSLGVTIGNIGIHCYNKMWYTESMPFMEAACTFLLKWCVEEESGKLERMQKINLWNKYQLLATDYRKAGFYESALDTLSKALVVYGEMQPDFFDCWIRTKRDAALSGSSNLKNRTLKSQLEKTKMSYKFNMYSFLQMELKAYKQANYYTNEEVYAVITAMLKEAKTNVQKAEYWIELAQVQWIKPLEYEPSPIDCCNKAVNLLIKAQESKKKDNLNGALKSQLARAFFWLYMCELQQTQENSVVKVAKAQVTPLDKKLEFPKGEEVNENDMCDVIPAHKHITVEAELKNLETLDRALDLWCQLVETDCDLVTDKPQAIQDLKAMAEIYALSKEVAKEMQSWQLGLTLAKHCGLATDIVTCASRLALLFCRTDKLAEADATLLSSKESLRLLGDSSADVYASVKYLVTAAEICLCKKEFLTGGKYLREAWCHTFLTKKSKLSYLLIADVKVVGSMYLLIPRAVYKTTEYQPWNDSNAIGLAIAALQHLMMVAKTLYSVAEQMNEKILYSPGFSHHIVNAISNVNVFLGRMYIDIGVPREARCYLKEQLAMCHRLALAIRSAEVLLLLSEVDLICDNTMDCQVKLNGVEYILGQNAGSGQAKVRTSQEHNRMSTSYSAVAVPVFLDHPYECECVKCSNYFLVELALNLIITQSDCLALDGALHEAVLLSLYVKKAYQKRSSEQSNRKAPPGSSPLKLATVLLQLSELLFSQEKYENALEIVDEGIIKLKSVSHHYVGLFSLLAKLMWRKSVCLVHIAAKHCHMTSVEWLSSQLLKHASSPDLFTDSSCSLQSKKSLSGVPLTPMVHRMAKLSSNSVDCFADSDFGDCGTPMVKLEDKRVLFASKLATCKAPVKKWQASKLIVDRNWCVEPDEVFDEGTENIPTNARKSKQSRTRTQSSETKTPLVQKPPVAAALFKSTSSQKTQRKSRSQSSNEKCVDKIPSNVFGLPGCWNDERPESDTENAENSAESVAKVPAKPKTVASRTSKRNCRIHTDVGMQTRNAAESVRKEDGSVDATSPLKLPMPSPPLDDVFLQPPSPKAELMGPPMELPRGGRREKNKTDTVRSQRSKAATPIDDEVEVLRRAEIGDFTSIQDLNKKFIQDENGEFTTEQDKIGFGVDSIVLMLEEAFGYVVHHPPCPLYSDLCIALTLTKGLMNADSSFFLSESASATLRHRTILNLERKPWCASKSGCDDQLAEEDLKRKERYRNIMKLQNSFELEKSLILKRHISCIPEGWVVCQISAVPSALATVDKHNNRQLVLARYESGKEPILMQVPSSHANQSITKNLLDAFNKILEDSKDTMKQEVRAQWWEARRALDLDVKMLLDDVENLWLGCWKALVMGNVVKSEDQDVLKNIFTKAAQACEGMSYSEELLKVIVNALPSLSSGQIKQAVSHMLQLNVKSSRVQSIARLLSKAPKNLSFERKPVILILGKEVEFLPWENMNILRPHPVSRMPSLSLLHGHISVLQAQSDSVHQNKADTTNTFFVLNPGDDLPHTQQSFEDLFSEKLQWSGIVKRAPNEEEITKALTMHDLFVYCGHGSGTKYLSGDRIQRLCCRAVSLLMGCSSGRLHGLGQNLEPAGVVLQYLLAGCPSVLGCLWDVTDRDIDKFLLHLLKSWINSADEQITLPASVCNARLACRLPYLIGCSPVVYGLPVMAQVSGKPLI